MRLIQTIEMMTRVKENPSLIGIVMSMALVLSLILFLEVSLISRISSPTRIYPKMEKEGIIDSFLKAGYQLPLIQIVALLVLVTFSVVMLQQHIILVMFSVLIPVVMTVVLVIPVLVLLASLFRWFAWPGRSREG